MISFVAFLAFTAVVLFLTKVYVDQKRKHDSLSTIPQISELPFFGATFELLANLDRQPSWWLDTTKRLGLVWAAWVLGQPPLVFVIDPVDVEYILKTNFQNYPKGPDFQLRLGDLLGNGIFNADGALWKTQRQVASHMFKTSSLKGIMLKTFREHSEMVIEKLDGYTKSKEKVDMQDIYYRFTLDSIGKIAFGKNLNSLNENVPFQAAFDCAQSEVERRFFVPWWKFRAERELKASLKVLDDFAYKLIKERKEDKDVASKDDILSRYITSKNENGEPYSDEYLRDTIMNFMIAGRDTTAQTLTWLTYLVATHPEKEKKLLAEIDALNGQIPTYDQLKSSLKYVNATINETLRLYPPVFGDPKQAVETDTLPTGHVIPRGAVVAWSAYVMGRHPKLWDDPEEFLPERWIDNNPLKYHPYQFIPFQAGPRTCLGQRMAYLEAGLLVCMLFRRFTFRLVPGHKVEYQRSITLPAKGGMPMYISPRVVSYETLMQ